jgi:hypothetical protein
MQDLYPIFKRILGGFAKFRKANCLFRHVCPPVCLFYGTTGLLMEGFV